MKQLNADNKTMSCSKNNILQRLSMEGKVLGTQDKENIENQSITNMIQMLKEYEQICIQKEDFVVADEVKNKIQFLKKQANILNKELISAKEQENIAEICREGQEEVKKFQMYWDAHVQEVIASLKEIEEKLSEQQKTFMIATEIKLAEEQPPPIKYSSKVLQMRKHLSSLIKMRRYKEAENIKNELKNLQIQEQDKWTTKFQQRKHYKIEQLQKKQHNELQALRIKLQGVFNQKIQERDAKFEILLKKNRKRRIDSSRCLKDKKSKLSMSFHRNEDSFK